MSPTEDHEIPLEFFRNRPELARKIATDVFGLDVPDNLCWRMGPETVTKLAPKQTSLDVALIGSSADRPRRAFIHEVQRNAGAEELERISYSWPDYVTAIRRRFRCPTTIMAYCPSPEIARLVREPMRTGHPGFDLSVLAYSPHDLKPITDPDQAREYPELVFLSAPAHAEEGGPAVLEAVAAALQATDDEVGEKYYDYVLSRLTAAARQTLEGFMTMDTYKPRSDWGRRLWSEGEEVGIEVGTARGEARAILTVLRSRDITVSSEAEARITGCTDLEQLTAWLVKVAHVTNVEELFRS